MGWKISILIIDKKYEKPSTELTREIGLGKSEILRTEKLEFNLYAYHPEISVGSYKDKTLIIYNNFIDSFFKEKPGRLEKKVCKVFNDCQMLLFVYHENAGLRGFSLINNGQRVRTKLVEDYQGTLIEVGNKLEDEKKRKFLDVWWSIPRRIIGKMIINSNMHVHGELQRIEMTILKLKVPDKN